MLLKLHLALESWWLKDYLLTDTSPCSRKQMTEWLSCYWNFTLFLKADDCRIILLLKLHLVPESWWLIDYLVTDTSSCSWKLITERLSCYWYFTLFKKVDNWKIILLLILHHDQESWQLKDYLVTETSPYSWKPMTERLSYYWYIILFLKADNWKIILLLKLHLFPAIWRLIDYPFTDTPPCSRKLMTERLSCYLYFTMFLKADNWKITLLLELHLVPESRWLKDYIATETSPCSWKLMTERLSCYWYFTLFLKTDNLKIILSQILHLVPESW